MILFSFIGCYYVTNKEYWNPVKVEESMSLNPANWIIDQ